MSLFLSVTSRSAKSWIDRWSTHDVAVLSRNIYQSPRNFFSLPLFFCSYSTLLPFSTFIRITCYFVQLSVVNCESKSVRLFQLFNNTLLPHFDTISCENYRILYNKLQRVRFYRNFSFYAVWIPAKSLFVFV